MRIPPLGSPPAAGQIPEGGRLPAPPFGAATAAETQRHHARKENAMHRHLHVVRLVPPRPVRADRAAKVIVLDVRRKARLEAARPERPPPRDAA